MAKAEKRRVVEKYRQCPVCYNGERNGIGKAYSSRPGKLYYKCDMCIHTWTVTKTRHQTVIEHDVRKVENDRLEVNGAAESAAESAADSAAESAAEPTTSASGKSNRTRNRQRRK